MSKLKNLKVETPKTTIHSIPCDKIFVNIFYKDYSNITSIEYFPFSLGGGIFLSFKNFKSKLKLVWIPFQHIYKIALKIPQ